jgi:hypothetical protein
MQAVMISTAANDPRDEFSATWMLVTDNANLLRQPEPPGSHSIRGRSQD